MIIWDFKESLMDLIPTKLKTQSVIDWFSLANSQLEILNDTFLTKRDSDIFDITHTNQILSLQHLLNYKLNVNGKPIKVVNGDDYPEYFISGYDDGRDINNSVDSYYNTILSMSVQYQPNNMYIADETATVVDSDELWIGSDTVPLEKDKLIVFVDYLDINILKDEINTLLKKYIAATCVYEIKPY